MQHTSHSLRNSEWFVKGTISDVSFNWFSLWLRGSDSSFKLTSRWWEVVILFILRNFPKSWTRFVLAASVFFLQTLSSPPWCPACIQVRTAALGGRVRGHLGPQQCWAGPVPLPAAASCGSLGCPDPVKEASRCRWGLWQCFRCLPALSL